MLEILYKLLTRNPTKLPNLYLPPSHVFYAKQRLDKHFGTVFKYKYVERLMFEEGLYPASSYGIPEWYIEKYGN